MNFSRNTKQREIVTFFKIFTLHKLTKWKKKWYNNIYRCVLSTELDYFSIDVWQNDKLIILLEEYVR